VLFKLNEITQWALHKLKGGIKRESGLNKMWEDVHFD
jgi:hypothetical protein